MAGVRRAGGRQARGGQARGAQVQAARATAVADSPATASLTVDALPRDLPDDALPRDLTVDALPRDLTVDALPRDLPDDADAPPEDFEPPFDPRPARQGVVEASVTEFGAASGPRPAPGAAADTFAPRNTFVPRGGSGSAPADGGSQRYGESVVREVLGATFLEEVEAPGRTGFGERG